MDGNNNIISGGNTAAISLLEKYSTINTHIDRARKDISQTQTSIDNARQEISNLVDVERIKMKNDISLAYNETNDLKLKKEKDVQHNLDRIIKKEHLDAVDGIKEANDASVNTRNWIKKRLEQFLESSRIFRLECKRIKIDFLEEGKAMIPSVVFLTSSKSMFDKDGQNDTGLCLSLDEIPNNDDYDRHSSSTTTNSYHKNAIDETHFNKKIDLSNYFNNDKSQTNNKDEERLQAETRLKSALKAKEESELGFKDAQKDYDKAKTRAEDRKSKLSQGRSQLSRIRKDIEDMEMDLNSLDRETRELQMIGETFEKDASRRITKVSNPYNRNSSIQQSSTNSDTIQEHYYQTHNTSQFLPNSNPSSNRSNTYVTAPHQHSQYYNNNGNSNSNSNSNSNTTNSTSDILLQTKTNSNRHEYTAQSFSFSTNSGSTTSTPYQQQQQQKTLSKSQSNVNDSTVTTKNPYKKNGIMKRTTTGNIINYSPRNNRTSSSTRGPAIIHDDDNDYYDNQYNSNNKRSSSSFSTMDEKQRHPHLAGRIRSRREFDTSLEIPSSSSSSAVNNDNNISEGISSSENNDNSILYESDEDDDKLLSYVAFSSSKKKVVHD